MAGRRYALGLKQLSLNEVEALYIDLSRDVFGASAMAGGSRIIRGGSCKTLPL